MATELKPCPFCGGSVSIGKTSEWDELWWYVTRGKGENPCTCRVLMESESFCKTDPIEFKRLCKERLIEAWNRRAEDGTA